MSYVKPPDNLSDAVIALGKRSSTTERELPKYVSHKEVWALRIKSVNATTITPEDDGYAAFEVSEQYIAKHDPKAGGYYVVYADGYRSFSPSDAFEQGYNRI